MKDINKFDNKEARILLLDLEKAEERAAKEGWLDADDVEKELSIVYRS